jgi:energy-coupling factor transporter ATP-binding protein EcfA2
MSLYHPKYSSSPAFEFEQFDFLNDSSIDVIIDADSSVNSDNANNANIPTVNGYLHQPEIDRLNNSLKEMPKNESAIRILIGLLISLIERSVKDFDVEKKKIELMNKALEEEELLNQEIEEMISSLNKLLEERKIPAFIKLLGRLLEKLRPLDLVETKRLINESKKAHQIIKGKKVIFLVGPTGVGKSTSVQYLAGCEMQKKKYDLGNNKWLLHIEAREGNEFIDIKKVSSCPLARSETRHINAVSIPFLNETIILCDSPGFGDTGGTELEIANNVGLLEALSSAKSVAIVAFISYQNMGDRGQGIQKLATLLDKMVNEIDKHRGSFIYLFTKFPEEFNDELIRNTLLDIKTQLNEKGDDVFVNLLDHMIDPDNKRVIKLDLFSRRVEEILKILSELQGIENPRTAFKMAVCEEASRKIETQVQIYKKGIENSLKRKDNEMTSYYLNCLKSLNDLTKFDFAKQAFDSSLQKINEFLKEKCSKAREHFQVQISSQIKFEESFITGLRDFISYINKIEAIKEYFGEIKFDSEIDHKLLIEFIQEEVRNSTNSITEECSPDLVEICLNNSALLETHFVDLKAEYEQLCTKIINITNSLIFEELKNQIDLKKCNIHLISKKLELLRKWTREDHLSKLLNNNCNEIATKLISNYKARADECFRIIEKSEKSSWLDDSLTELAINLECLREASEYEIVSFSFVKYANQDQAYSIVYGTYNLVLDRLLTYLENSKANIVNHLEQNAVDYSFLDETKDTVDRMTSLIKLDVNLKLRSAQIYYQTIEAINVYIHGLEIVCADLLAIGNNQTLYTKLELEIISKHFEFMSSNSKWLENHCPGLYDSISTIILEIINDYIEWLVSLINDEKNKYDIEKIYHILFNRIEPVKILAKFMSLELAERPEEIVNEYIEEISYKLDSIIDDYDLNKIKKQGYLEKLETLKAELDKKNPAIQYIQEKHGFSKIEILENGIETFKQQKQEKEKELNKKNGNDFIVKDTINFYRKHIEELELDRVEYYKIKSNSTIMKEYLEEEKTLLKQENFNSVEELDKEITAQKSLEEQSELFDFEKLDWIATNNFIRFLKVISELDRLNSHSGLSNRIIEANKYLSSYLFEYGKFIKNMFIDMLKSNLISKDSDEIEENYSEIKMLVKELNTLKNVDLLYEGIRGTEILSSWHQYLEEKYDYLEEYLKNHMTINDENEFNLKLKNAFNLAELVKFLYPDLKISKFYFCYLIIFNILFNT